MKSIKIGFFIGDFKRSGGTERICVTIANELSKLRNYEVFLFCTNKVGEQAYFDVDKNVKIIYLDVPNLKMGFIKLQWKVVGVFRKEKLTHFVGVEMMSIYFILLPSLFLKKSMKLIMWEHFNFFVDLGKKSRIFARKLSMLFASSIVVLTEQDKCYWNENLKGKAKVITINNVSSFSNSLNDYNLTSKKIITVGRLTYQKGFDILINIWSEFCKKFPEYVQNGWHLDILGEGEDRMMLIDMVNELGINDSVNFVGQVSNVQDFYKESSFLVMTSRFEGLPMTLLEAQSYGLPIISFNCKTGPSEIIDESNGYLVEEGEDVLFIESMLKLIESQDLRIKMSNNAKLNTNRFSKKVILKEWEDLLSE